MTQKLSSNDKYFWRPTLIVAQNTPQNSLIGSGPGFNLGSSYSMRQVKNGLRTLIIYFKTTIFDAMKVCQLSIFQNDTTGQKYHMKTHNYIRMSRIANVDNIKSNPMHAHLPEM